MTPTEWSYYKPHLQTQRVRKEYATDTWLERDSLKRPRVNPVTYAVLAALIVGAAWWWSR